jgi:hypothetical protein
MQSAVDRGRIPANPCSGVKLLSIDNEEMNFLTRLPFWRSASILGIRPMSSCRHTGDYGAAKWQHSSLPRLI